MRLLSASTDKYANDRLCAYVYLPYFLPDPRRSCQPACFRFHPSGLIEPLFDWNMLFPDSANNRDREFAIMPCLHSTSPTSSLFPSRSAWPMRCPSTFHCFLETVGSHFGEFLSSRSLAATLLDLLDTQEGGREPAQAVPV